jgi:hypothetical protein
MTILKAQQGFARVAVAFIVGAALVLTYDGTMRFAQAHGALGWRGAVIAAMNDLAVLVGILWPEKPLQALAALCSALTIWGNLDHAQPTVGGYTIALVPPLLAILMVAALEYLVRHPALEIVAEAPVGQVTHTEPEPVPVEVPEIPVEVPETEPVPVHRVDGTDETPWDRERVMAWLSENPGITLKEAQAHTGIPKSTIGRWKNAA